MAINAGTIMAYLDMDTSGFTHAFDAASEQLEGFAGGGIEGALGSIGAAATTAGRALTMGVTTPLLGVAAAGVKVGMDFDASMSNVYGLMSSLNLNAEQMEALRETAREMGASTRYSASEAADAMGYMALAGWDDQQVIAGLPGVLNLAAAANMDLARASDIVTDTMTPFGMAAEEAARAADVFAYAQANSNTNVEALGDAMRYAAPNADAFGMTLEDTAAAMGVLANAGIKGSMAGTTLNAILRDLKNNSEKGAIAIGKTKVAITDADGEYRDYVDIIRDIDAATTGMSSSQRDAALAAIFGDEAIKGVNATLKQSPDALQAMTDGLYGCKDAASEMSAIMQDNLKGDLTTMMSGVQEMGIALSDYLTPVIRGGVQAATGLIAGFNKLDTSTKNLIFRAGAMAAAAGPVLLVGGKLLTTFSGLVAPLGLVAAGFAAAYNLFPEFASVIDSGIDAVQDFGRSLLAGESVTDAFAGAIERSFGHEALGAMIAFKSNATRHIGDAVNAIKSGAISMGDALRAEANAIKSDWSEGGALGALAGFGERMGDRIKEALPAIGEAALGIRDKIGEGISMGVEWFAPRARTMLGNLGTALGNAKAYATEHLPAVRTAISDGLQIAKTKLSTMAQTALGNLSTAYRDAKSYATEHLPAVSDAIADGLQIAKTKLTTTAQIVMANLGTALGNAKDYVTYHLPAIRSSIADGLQVAKTTLVTKAQDAMTWLGEAYRSDEVQGLLGDLSGVATTIAGKISVTKEQLIGKAGELLKSLGEALGTDEAKAKITEITGVVAAIAGNITSTTGAWQATATAMITDLVTQLTDNGFLTTLLGDDTHGLGGVVTAIAGGIGTAASNIASAASDIGGELIGALTADDGKLISDLFTNASTVVSAIGGKIVDAAGSITASATSLATKLLSGLNDINWATLGSQVGISLGNIAGSLINGIITNAPKVIDNAGPLVDAIGAGIANAGTALGSAAGQLVGGLITWLLSEENWDRLLRVGASLVMGIGEGMSHVGDYMLEGVANGLDSFVQNLKTSLTGDAPSAYDQFLASTYKMTGEWGREMEVTGNWIAASLHPGHIFADGTDSLKNAISAYAIAAGQGFQDEFANVSYLANDAVVGLLMIVSNSFESETDRAKAAAALNMAGYTDAVAMALGSTQGGVQVAAAAKAMMNEANAEVSAASQELGTLIPGALSSGYDSGIPILQQAAQRLGNIASGAWEKDTTLKDAEDVAKGVTDSTAKKLDDGKQDVTTSADGITTAVEGSLEPLPGRMEALSENGVLGMSAAIDNNKSAVTTSMDTLADETVQTALRTMSEAQGHEIGAVFTRSISIGLTSLASMLVSSSSGTAQNGVQAAASAMTHGDGYGIGANMVNGIISGVASRAGALASRMRELARSAVNAAKRALDINSPSGVMAREVGAWLPGGIGVGVAKHMSDALGPLDEVRRSMVSVFDNTLSGVRLGTPDVPWAPAGSYGGGAPVVHIEITGDWQVRSDDDRDDIIDALYERISEQIRRR